MNQSLDLSTYIDKLDIIGDIHGCYHTLVDLLVKLGYKNIDGVWQHSERIAVFMGDYIDRGIYIPQVLDLIKSMVDRGKAIALLGNHEMNLIGVYTLGKDGKPLRSHKKLRQHHVTIRVLNENKLHYWIEWFKKLPIFLDLGKLRLVHAAWHDDYIELIKQYFPNNRLADNLQLAFDNTKQISGALRYILKGPEISLSQDVLDIVKRKHPSYKLKEARIRWWDTIPPEPTFREATLVIDIDRKVPQDITELYKPYPPDAPILFFGHYSMDSHPHIIRDNVQCVDFGVYKKKFLTAYRYRGEKKLSEQNIVYIPHNKQDIVS